MFPVDAEKIHLLVGNVQITKTTDVKSLSLFKNSIIVFEPKKIKITVGKISFSHYFNLDFTGQVLCEFVLQTMQANGYEIPKLDFGLVIDGKEVDVKEMLCHAGCKENSSVLVVSKGGEDLTEIFDDDDDDDDDSSEYSESEEQKKKVISEETPVKETRAEIHKEEEQKKEEFIISCSK